MERVARWRKSSDMIGRKGGEVKHDAITAIASGAAGGPMSAMSGLIGGFLGVESAPICFGRNGVKWSVKASNLVDMGLKAPWGSIRTRPSRSMWKPFSGFHRNAISTAVFAPCRSSFLL